MTLILEPLRTCRVCGLEAQNQEDLALFKGSHVSKHGKENLCKECRKGIDRAYSKSPRGKAIQSKAKRTWEKNNPDKLREATEKYRSTERYRKLNNEYRKQHRKLNPEKWKIIDKRSKDKLNMDVFKKLGDIPECARCHIKDIRVLTVDHIHNNGAEERAKLRRDGIFRKIRDMSTEEARKEYQILCRNCNWIKFLNSAVRQER